MSTGLRDTFKTIAPPWLSEGNAEKFQYAIGLVCDEEVELAYEGVLARMPGLGTPTALHQIALDRNMAQGPAESDASFSIRLNLAFPSWRRAGVPGVLLRQIKPIPSATYNGRVSTVDGNSNWCDLATDGTESYYSTLASAPWLWATNWFEAWIILYPNDDGTPAFANGPKWGDGHKWGDGSQWGLSGAGNQMVGTLSQILEAWRPAHETMVCVIVPLNTTDFTPGHMPDSTFQKAYKIVGGVAVPSRFGTSRYIGVA